MDELSGARAFQQVLGGGPRALVHAHIERRRAGVGEAPRGLVELKGGDAQVHEDGVHRPIAICGVLTGHPVHGVVGVSDRDEAVAEALQTRRCQCDRLWVAVDAHDLQSREALECRLGVSPQAQRAVDHDRPGRGAPGGALDRRREQVQTALEEYRLVPADGVGGGRLRLGAGHAASSFLEPARCCVLGTSG